jgi:hypothetical protein
MAQAKPEREKDCQRMPIDRETVRRINADYAGITLDEPREAELAVELTQFLDASERGRHRLDFNLDPHDFRVALIETGLAERK